jgi:hypothetical protein
MLYRPVPMPSALRKPTEQKYRGYAAAFDPQHLVRQNNLVTLALFINRIAT